MLCEKLDEKKGEFSCPVVSYSIGNDVLVIQSPKIGEGTSLFLIKVLRDLTFMA